MLLNNHLKLILFLGSCLLLVSCEKRKVAMNSNTEVIVKFVPSQVSFANSELPVVVYKKVSLSENPRQVADFIQQKFFNNGWRQSWRNGLYNFHHYHSNTHEALGIYRGWVEVQLGGPGGDIVKLEQGDVVIIPAGVAHKNMNQSSDFAILGAYPNSLSPNMRYGEKAEAFSSRKEVESVLLPKLDPFYGTDGQLLDLWK